MSKPLEPFRLDGPYTSYTVIAAGRYYDNNCRAIQLLDAHDGSLCATATVNIPGADIDDDEVFIKNWSENEGVLKSMVAAGYIEESCGQVQTGFVFADRCRLTEKGKGLFG